MGGISIWQLLIVFGIVVLVFGTRKLRNMGGDIGGAIRNFKQAMNSEDSERKTPADEDQDAPLERKEADQPSSTSSAESERKQDHS